VLVYGLLGLVPFLAPPLVGTLFPDVKDVAATVLALYGGLILSFLGGARWGLAVAHPSPLASVITLSMIPTLAALALLLLPAHTRLAQLLGLAVALVLHWLWDLRGKDLPAWYAGLRTMLTVGAAIGLVAGAILLTP